MGISRGWGQQPGSQTHFKRGSGQNKIREKSDRRNIAACRCQFGIGPFVLLGLSLNPPGCINVKNMLATRNPFGTPWTGLFSLSRTTDGTSCIVHLGHKELIAPFLSGDPSKS